MLKTGMRAWSNAGGKAHRLEQLRMAVDPCRCPTRVVALRHDLHGERRSGERVHPDHDRVEARTEVVDVRDDDRVDAAALQLGERSGRPNRREDIAVTRAIERRLSVLLEEHGAVGPDAGCSGLAEPEWVSEPLLGDVRTDDLVRREARHHGHGNLDPERVAKPSGLAELDLEEASAVDRLGDRLDAAAEARRHSAGEHDHRHGAGLEPVDTGRLGLGEARIAGLR